MAYYLSGALKKQPKLPGDPKDIVPEKLYDLSARWNKSFYGKANVKFVYNTMTREICVILRSYATDIAVLYPDGNIQVFDTTVAGDPGNEEKNLSQTSKRHLDSFRFQKDRFVKILKKLQEDPSGTAKKMFMEAAV